MLTPVREAWLFRVRMPLVSPFRTARSTTTAKNALLVKVRTDAGVGWGECVAQRDASYAPETIDTAWLAVRDLLLPRAFAGVSDTDVRGHSAAKAALECARLDAHLRATGTSLASHLGATASTVPAGVAIGMVDDVGELPRVAGAYAAQGYRRIKIKIEPGRDVEYLREVRDQVGPGVALAADANGSYDLDGACALFDVVDNFGLQNVEQPLAPDALHAHAALARHGITPICLDESITSATTAADAIDAGACHAVSVKAGHVGGLYEARRVVEACAHRKVDALAGGMLETGIGRAALLAVAALPGMTAIGDCSASDRYFGPDGDLTEPFVLEGGHLTVPTGPGLGVEPIPERLTRCTVARERITP